MKKILLLTLLLIPVLLSAQNKPGKKDKTIIVYLHPLQGQSDNFEKGLAHHNQTFHNGKDPIDVYEVISGEQTGEFAFVYRNGYSWSDVDATSKNAEDKEHAADWDQNVAKYITYNAPRNFYAQSEDSYLPAEMSGMNPDLSVIYAIGIVPGKESEFYAGLKKIQEMHRKNNSKNYYLIQTRVFGKGNQVLVIIPLQNGWSSLEPDPNDDWAKMFKKAFPTEDYKAWEKKFEATQNAFESFVVKFRKDLSSPQ